MHMLDFFQCRVCRFYTKLHMVFYIRFHNYLNFSHTQRIAYDCNRVKVTTNDFSYRYFNINYLWYTIAPFLM